MPVELPPDPALVPRVPVATYRLQFNQALTFEAARRLVPYLDALTGLLGEANPDLQEFQSIITALDNLPPRTETAPESVRARLREKEVIRRRLARLVEACPTIRDSLEESVRIFNGKRGDPRSFDLLDRLLDSQAYRLAYWRVAAEEINYRRFFDVNELAAIRMERAAVFREAHRLILRLVEEGKVTGLRLDHPDGLFVDARNEKAVTAAYTAFTGQRTSFPDLACESKRLIMETAMSSELNVLGHALDRLSEGNRYSRDFTLNSLTRALREVVACFPVYRTYIDGRGPAVNLQDRACIEVAVAFARRRNPAMDVSVFDFVRDTPLLRYQENADQAYRDGQLAFVQRFQQLTAPITAKGVEDTAFYRYNRLVSLNEVGGDPERFGIPLEEFHAQCQARQAKWPLGLSATSTHDTKRSEDVRARLNALSEIPREWRAAVGRRHRWNRRHAAEVDSQWAPDRNDEYLLYQTLVGAWPLTPLGPDEMTAFTARIQQYMLKAAKEAKRNTSCPTHREWGRAPPRGEKLG